MVVLIVQEVKRNAVGGCTPEQAEKWVMWLKAYEPIGRVGEIPGTSTLIGNNWEVQCEDREHAVWLRDWLISDCGFRPTMLRIKGAR